MKAISNSALHLFALLGVIFIPASTYILPIQDKLAVWVFGDLVELFIDQHLDFTSDTLGLNVLLLILLLVGVLLSVGMHQTSWWAERRVKILQMIRTIIVFYIASRLFVYGFDKIFKTQFYLPEPNTLYTPLGLLSKDILFWSSMGTSKWYCLLTGIFEVIPACLLLFRRTRVAGLLMTCFVLIHVLTINIGFDISVKLYSLFLLFLSLLLLFPNFKNLFAFFFRSEHAKLSPETIPYKDLYAPKAKSTLKSFVIGLVLIEALSFPISTGEWHDDLVERPFLHGAYEVIGFTNFDGAPVPAPYDLRRFFFHRREFLIYQMWDDRMIDYQYWMDGNDGKIQRTDALGNVNQIQYRLYEDETILHISDMYKGEFYWIVGKKLDWQSLPAVQDEFHWTLESYE